MKNFTFWELPEHTTDTIRTPTFSERFIISKTFVSSTSNTTSHLVSSASAERRGECVVIAGVFGVTNSHGGDVFQPERRRTKGSILRKIQELAERVPEEEWSKLPTDFSSQKHHYLYGTRKD